MKIRDFQNILCNTAKSGLKIQNFNGSFPAGKNGPWKHEVTPVRNTAHWAYLMYSAYLISNNENYRSAAIKACDYLLRPEHRPGNATYYCRISPKSKLKSNGLIGQAWAIEPLIFIGNHEKNQKYLEIAEQILSIHPFNKRKGLFESVEIDGTCKGINGTLNQQIWFTASILSFCKTTGAKNGKLYSNATKFLSNITNKIDIYKDGCIKHSIKKSLKSRLKQNIIKYAKSINLTSRENNNTKSTPYTLRELSVGYQSFILAGLSLAFKYSNELSFWPKIIQNKKMKQAIKYSYNAIESANKNSVFAFQYNPTGIENAFFWQTFGNYISLSNDEKYIKNAILKQLGSHYNYEIFLMNKNTVDPDTLSARFYELSYLIN